MTINAAIYARSSADCSASVEQQVECLQAVATSQGWRIAKIFSDRPMPIKRGREQRPGEMALLAAIRSGGVNKVLMFSIDRAGRSLTELVWLLEACRSAGVSLYVHEQNLDTVASNGLTIFDVASMLAHHLRQNQRDRILRGQAAARNANVRFGRPPMARTKVDKAQRELAAGKGVREAARIAGISAASVSRLKTAMNAV